MIDALVVGAGAAGLRAASDLLRKRAYVSIRLDQPVPGHSSER